LLSGFFARAATPASLLVCLLVRVLAIPRTAGKVQLPLTLNRALVISSTRLLCLN